ncbi:hypothetical protein [Candidatus Parabeggiatoa sp. HSG14]|uniref:hypothetical protein n=1 Tax=Candidatus Parabeggiatoa sp. HSG14 TaxID=3055593 RepID=UPI0025A73954|nr:hypothetical protein [Thiotrichales bacterium HSG14]
MQTGKKDFMGKFWTVLSNIKVSKWPFFMFYRPHSFTLKGNHTREIMKLVKPGDILVRSFNNYLNGYFMEGTFKHVGFYLSEVSEQHLKQFAQIQNPTEYNTGRQMVIYTIGDKIFLEDLIDFCRCDGLAIMRFPRQLKSLARREIPEILQAYFENPIKPVDEVTDEESEKNNSKKKKGKKAKEEKDEPPKEPVKPDATTLAIVKAEKDIAQHIANGKGVEFEKIFKILYRIALRQLSTPYDYDFGIDQFPGLTSTEFVYFITKSICWNYGIEAESSRIFLKKRLVITPDMFVDGDLEEVWKSDI